ncbi:STAS domain-containing protein [Allorhizocola rhizosphaerae]|uniref:STAS domain-containing protein n=1 Tax=Allorhizocola rhizosphaerae TaxID=1872709 RepID=UPI0013C3086C|nr:STAS domain-containing protein [Allorhizocola rhizosphaerae]
MTVSHRRTVDGATCTVALIGEIDMTNVDDALTWIRETVDTTGCSRLEIDLGELDFIDSAGVRMLIQARDYAMSHAAAMAVTQPQAMIYDVLELCGVASALGLAPRSEP